jgi:adhesin HecA-like repeat protein
MIKELHGAVRRLAGVFEPLLALCLFGNALLAQATLQVTSPANGAVVAPGQTITVTATPSPGAVFVSIIVIGKDPIGFGPVLTAPPYVFSIQLPQQITPGIYTLGAVGSLVSGGEPIFSNRISIDVERPDNPVRLGVDLSPLISSVGDHDLMSVFGVYGDGSKYDLGRSSKTTYVSNTPSVATVDNRGMIIAVAPGTASITVANGPNASFVVPVTVLQPISIMPQAKRLYASQTQRFTARAGFADIASVTWSLNPPGAGSIDNTGLYTAPSSISTQQDVTIIATSTLDNRQGATATVTLYPPILATVTGWWPFYKLP